MTFIHRAVYAPITDLPNFTWQEAHELLLIFLRALESDARRRITFANVCDERFDTSVTQARLNSATFFRSRAGNAQGDAPITGVTPNGKFSAATVKACVAFNLGRRCTHLELDGTCKFNHICNQFVSDKGPRGICGGNHPRSICNYDAAKKLEKPLA